MHVRLTALLPILLAAGCATNPDKDPVQLRLNDLEARVARMERIVANEVQVSQNVDEMQGNLRELHGEIEQLQHHGHRLNDVAILVRASFQMRAFEYRFVTLGLNYRVIGGPRFYERQEVRDALAYFRATVQPADDLAF